MSAINYAFAERNTEVSSDTSSFTAVTDLSIASGSFTAGKQYLILATACIKNTNAGNRADLRMVHGSTAFADSTNEWLAQTANTETYRYFWWTVWTAVSSEAITMQKQNTGGTSSIVNFGAILAINLSDDLTENTDWFYNERTTDDGITTTPTAGGTITFTPSAAAQNWLVLTSATVSFTEATTHVVSALDRSGEATSATPAVSWRKGFAGTNQFVISMMRAFSLGASSNTFKEMISVDSGTAHTRLNSRIFALNLAKFNANAVAYTDADVNLSATDYATELQTVTIAPPTTDLFILSGWGVDVGSYAREFEERLQFYIDGGAQSDQPAGQTTANYQFKHGAGGSASEEYHGWFTKAAVTSGNTYRADMDGSSESTTGTPSGQYRQIAMFTAELAATSTDNQLQRAGRGVLRGLLRGGR